MASELELPALVQRYRLDASGYDKGAKQVESSSKSAGSAGHSLGKVIAGVTAAVGIATTANFLKGTLGDFRESERIGRLTEQVIKSTGGAANVTAAQMGNYANALALTTGVDDEIIQSGENVLATFTNVRNEVGKGNDIFNRATSAALDMSAALGTDMQGSVLGLGKALNDPIKGITALSRVGVSFTEQQKEQIKTLVASGDVLGAQKVILSELGKEFGGAAQAAADPIAQLQVAWGNLKESLGGAIAPVASELATSFGAVVPQIMASLGPLTTGIADMATGLAPVFADAFAAIGPLIGSTLGAVTGLVTSFAGPLIGAFGEVAPFLTQFVNVLGDTFASIDLEGPFNVLAEVLGTVAQAASTFVPILGDVFAAILPVIDGVVRSVVDVVQTLIPVVAPILQTLATTFTAVFASLGPVISQLVSSLGPVLVSLGEALGSVFETIGPVIASTVSALAPAFAAIGDAVKASAPALGTLGKAFGTILGAVGPILPMLARLVTQIVSALAPVLPTLANAVAQVAQSLAGGLAQALAAILPPIAKVAGILAGALGKALQVLAPVIADVAEKVGGALGSAMELIGPLIGQVVEALTPLVEQLIDALLPVLPDLIDAWLQMQTALLPLIPPLLQIVTDLLPPLLDLVTLIIPPVIGLATALTGGLASALSAVAGWVTKVVEWLGDLLGHWTELPGKIVDGLADIGTTIWNGVKDGFTYIKDHVSDWITDRVDDLIALPGKVVQGWGIIGQTLWNGARSGFDWVKEKIGGWISDRVADLKALPGKLKDGFVSAISKVKDIGTEILDAIGEGLAGAADWASDVGKTIANAVIRFINSQIIHRINDLLEFTIPGPGPLPDFHIDPPDIPDIKEFAKGGIVDSATLALIGEAGSEAVLPLENTNTMRALGATLATHLAAALVSHPAAITNTTSSATAQHVEHQGDVYNLEFSGVAAGPDEIMAVLRGTETMRRVRRRNP